MGRVNKSVYSDMTKAELLVSNFLTELGFWWSYEQGVFIADEKGRPRLWAPDFYVPDLGIYIEVVGGPELSNYKYREDIYHKNRIPIIFILPYHMENWQGHLVQCISDIHHQRWELIKRL